MKQVIQNFKTGDLYVDDVPAPSLSSRMVLVANAYSLISAGTERSTVSVAQASLLGKARQRPDLVAQVIQNVKKEGLKATLEKVRTKLDSLKALGYSTSGTVIASMDSHQQFQPGDRVACAGQDFASHAEVVSVPQNLVVRIPDSVSFEEAAFTTLGAIALQGVRQAEPRLGEKVCVIGLGLLGQLTCQLLRANGCAVFGIDLSETLVDLAKNQGADAAMKRDADDLLAACNHFTKGYGFDTVIITAATSSNDPIELSAEISRKKGKVVAVGAVSLNVPRDPHFYRKELDLRLSCSYGPGRYDINYEENGEDYPFGFVRWTEQRNMEAFLQLLAQGRIDVKPLITHQFSIAEAADAYDIVMGKTKLPHMGILLQYPDAGAAKPATTVALRSNPVQSLQVGFIGAGSFAQSYLLPAVKNYPAGLETVVTSKGITAKNVADKFGFNKASSEAEDILQDTSINTVFIATPHSSHADYVLRCVEAGKNVFVEKPLAMLPEELSAIRVAYEKKPVPLMVGFNRRFSPAAKAIRKFFANAAEPFVIHYRVNAGFIPREHWTQQENLGGGRIVGEVCHFVDLIQYFCQSNPVEVYAQCTGSTTSSIKNDDQVSIQLKMDDGSIASILYTANGDKSMGKERVEVYNSNRSAILDDFKTAALYQDGKSELIKKAGKGHREEVKSFLDHCLQGSEPPISFESMYLTTLTSFAILDSLRTGLPQRILQ